MRRKDVNLLKRKKNIITIFILYTYAIIKRYIIFDIELAVKPMQYYTRFIMWQKGII